MLSGLFWSSGRASGVRFRRANEGRALSHEAPFYVFSESLLMSTPPIHRNSTPPTLGRRFNPSRCSPPHPHSCSMLTEEEVVNFQKEDLGVDPKYIREAGDPGLAFATILGALKESLILVSPRAALLVSLILWR